MSRRPKVYSLKNSPIPALVLLAVFYTISLIALWPGVMSPDANTQYAAAVTGAYTDHHPPVMSLWWHYLDKIYPGPGLMFTFHITMLYMAAAIFVYMFRNSKFKWWYAIYPLIPNMLAYTSLIVKDAGFTYCYLLSGAILAYLMVNRDSKHQKLFLLAVTGLLFYGTAVKFQAQYLLVFFTIGIVYCLSQYKLNARTIINGIGLNFAILLAILLVNSHLVPQAKKSNSWQLVKLYDLSALSIELNQPMYPEFILRQDNFDFNKVKHLFEPREVDSLVFPKDSVLKAGANEEQRELLWEYWFSTIKKHPFLYLKARLKLFSYNITSAPSERSDPVQFLSTTALKPLLKHSFVANLITAGYSVFKIALRFMWLLPILALHCYIAIRKFNQVREAAPLLMFSVTSIAMLLILLFLSMAGTARYVFLCTCLIHASHGFAYRAWEGKKHK